jgi:HTH-type transcriptional regulator / antitoxin HipB
MSEHVRWERRRDSDALRTGYEAARRTYALGKEIRSWRLELGIAQMELARRAGMTQSAVSRLEAGGAVPLSASPSELPVRSAPTSSLHSPPRAAA